MYESIVVGVTNTARSIAALEQARQLAEKLGSKLEIVSAYSDRGGEADVATERRHVEGLLERCKTPRAPGGTRTHALPGDAGDAILQVAEEVGADLVVVGNRGLQGMRRVLGSVPNDVLHKAPCSVLIIDTSE
jgi:nucleotide-binding universal stress UspA family protein